MGRSENIISYINEYGSKSFNNMQMNEVDILVLSQLAYNDYRKIMFRKKDLKFSDIIDELIKENPFGNGSGRKAGRTVIDALKDKKRYSDIIINDYEYAIGENYQFGALTITVDDKTFIVFEGTDGTIPGWKEDIEFAYKFPTRAQYLAGKYVNKIMNKYSGNVWIIGHSKGGNLALVGALQSKIENYCRIKNIYTFDSPGLKNLEYHSLRYKMLKNKVNNYIVKGSVIGVLLNKDDNIVLDSESVGILQHSALMWIVDGKKLKRGEQTDTSKCLQVSLKRLLSLYDKSEKKTIIDNIFFVFEDNKIESFSQLGSNVIEYTLDMVKSSTRLNEEDKKLIFKAAFDFLDIFSENMMKTKKDEVNAYRKKIKDKFSKYFSK